MGSTIQRGLRGMVVIMLKPNFAGPRSFGKTMLSVFGGTGIFLAGGAGRAGAANEGCWSGAMVEGRMDWEAEWGVKAGELCETGLGLELGGMLRRDEELML